MCLGSHLPCASLRMTPVGFFSVLFNSLSCFIPSIVDSAGFVPFLDNRFSSGCDGLHNVQDVKNEEDKPVYSCGWRLVFHQEFPRYGFAASLEVLCWCLYSSCGSR